MRYVIGLLLGIGLIVLTFILIFRIFSGGHNAPKEQPVQLADYANSNVVVRYTVDGPVVANQDHNKVRITVGKDQTLFEQIRGYEGQLVQTKTYPNNVQAFNAFLRSLQIAQFQNGNTLAEKDDQGYCALGRRFVYEAIDGGDTLFRWWNTSCSNRQGSFQGRTDTVRTLFQRQVPDYNVLVRGVNL